MEATLRLAMRYRPTPDEMQEYMELAAEPVFRLEGKKRRFTELPMRQAVRYAYTQYKKGEWKPQKANGMLRAWHRANLPPSEELLAAAKEVFGVYDDQA